MEKYKEFSWDDLKAIFAESDRRNAEIIANLEKSRAETDRMLAEQFRQTAEQIRISDQMLTNRIAETDRRLDEKFSRTERMIANSNERIEGISKSNGTFCEEYFINSFKENPVFLGEKFDRIIENHKPLLPKIDDEYDLILLNGSTIVLIEMKYKAGTDDVGKMFSKLNSYRTNYPELENYKIYLGLASFSFSKIVRTRAEQEGIVLIQQRGDKIEIVTENVRAW